MGPSIASNFCCTETEPKKLKTRLTLTWDFPDGLGSKESAQTMVDKFLIPGFRKPPGEGNATHSSIMAWRIPWSVGPGRLHSMGSSNSQTPLKD